MTCRHCGAPVELPFLDLGTSPPSNAFLTPSQLHAPETWYPLRLLVCTACWLVQTEDYAGREAIFTDDYVYFSSISTSWVAHARRYVDAVVERFGLGPGACVVEVAANDGYLLQFVQQRGIPCYGVEPTRSTAGGPSVRSRASAVSSTSVTTGARKASVVLTVSVSRLGIPRGRGCGRPMRVLASPA